MISLNQIRRRARHLLHRLHDDRAAQIVEFAVSLPLLVVFVVGIFDFSNAFTIKQKLTNIARDAAREAASDPANDLGNTATVPASVVDAFWVVDNYLVANKINDCGITVPTTPSSTLTWTAAAPGGCVPGIRSLTINRGYYFPANTAQIGASNCTPQAVASSQTAIISTCVSIQYNYQWRFGRVASLLGPSTSLPGTITVMAVAMNEN